MKKDCDYAAIAYTILQISWTSNTINDGPTVINRMKMKLKPSKDNFDKTYKSTIDAIISTYRNVVKEKIWLVIASKILKQYQTDNKAVIKKMDTDDKVDAQQKMGSRRSSKVL